MRGFIEYASLAIVGVAALPQHPSNGALQAVARHSHTPVQAEFFHAHWPHGHWPHKHHPIFSGEKGYPGDKGDQGPQGDKGDRGELGAHQGPPGDKGDKGPRGDKGTDEVAGLKDLHAIAKGVFEILSECIANSSYAALMSYSVNPFPQQRISSYEMKVPFRVITDKQGKPLASSSRWEVPAGAKKGSCSSARNSTFASNSRLTMAEDLRVCLTETVPQRVRAKFESKEWPTAKHMRGNRVEAQAIFIGKKGDKGSTGPKGDKGPRGPAGVEFGPKGNKGPTGAKGYTGSGSRYETPFDVAEKIVDSLKEVGNAYGQWRTPFYSGLPLKTGTWKRGKQTKTYLTGYEEIKKAFCDVGTYFESPSPPPPPLPGAPPPPSRPPRPPPNPRAPPDLTRTFDVRDKNPSMTPCEYEAQSGNKNYLSRAIRIENNFQRYDPYLDATAHGITCDDPRLCGNGGTGGYCEGCLTWQCSTKESPKCPKRTRDNADYEFDRHYRCNSFIGCGAHFLPGVPSEDACNQVNSWDGGGRVLGDAQLLSVAGTSNDNQSTHYNVHHDASAQDPAASTTIDHDDDDAAGAGNDPGPEAVVSAQETWLRGDKGDRGPPGDKGPRGGTGDSGDWKGNRGGEGDRGETGPDGYKARIMDSSTDPGPLVSSDADKLVKAVMYDMCQSISTYRSMHYMKAEKNFLTYEKWFESLPNTRTVRAYKSRLVSDNIGWSGELGLAAFIREGDDYCNDEMNEVKKHYIKVMNRDAFSQTFTKFFARIGG